MGSEKPVRNIVALHRKHGSSTLIAHCDDNSVWAFDEFDSLKPWRMYPSIPGTTPEARDASL